MAIVTTITSVSARYYEKRNRAVAELNVKEMCRMLGETAPPNLSTIAKRDLINLALALHEKLSD